MNVVKAIRHLVVGTIAMQLTSMSLPVLPDAWVQVFTPAGEVAGGRLSGLLAMTDEDRLRPLIEHRQWVHAIG
ncbi:hypothetical protein ACFVVM_05615 [Nocardia sp. NPDC058176]|uniref:hypothetical protein n=1 Tax=Nocardia sp. NPDC058176 TaxID=3346368 RepID=UPI0036D8CE28